MADTSWDSDFDFEQKTIVLPKSLKLASDSTRKEGAAAKDLAVLITQLRTVLMGLRSMENTEAIKTAVSLVHASLLDESDEFYSCECWKKHDPRELSVVGDSFGDVLTTARRCLAELDSVAQLDKEADSVAQLDEMA